MFELFKHQSDAVDFAVKTGSCALFHEPGLGKTRSIIETFKINRQHTPGLRMLVVCPLSIVYAAWINDVQKFSELKAVAFNDMKPGEKADIIIINFEGLITEKRLPEIKRLMSAGDWMLAVDESSRMKSHKSITAKTLLRLAPLARYRIVASGTPMPNSEAELWAQISFVDKTLLPESFYAFRNRYFYLGRGREVLFIPQGKIMARGQMRQLLGSGWKYQITPKKREELLHRIAPVCHWVKKCDALDLPDKIDEVREVRLNPNEKKMYIQMRNHLVAEIKGEIVTAEVALAKLMKLRQATSGFLYSEEHAAIRPGRSSKMRELGNVLEELGQQQVIIWTQFTEEVERISAMLDEEGKTYVTLYGGTKDREASIKLFQEGKAQYLIAHPRSAGHGLTFTNCHSMVFFSIDYSYEANEQARDRIHRIGQTNKCLYIYLIAKNTIDEMVYDVLGRKKSLQDVVYQLMKEGVR